MQQKTTTLKNAVELFLLETKYRRFTPDTQRFYKERLALLVTWCESKGVLTLQDLSSIHLKEYLATFVDRKLSSSYQHGHARAIRAFLNYSVQDGLLDVSPFAKVRMPKLEKKILPALAKGEIRRVLQHCKTERDKAIIYFLLDSGCRASEAIELNIGDVDLSTGVVNVQNGKGQKDRTTYIGAKTRKQLKRYLMERTDAGKTDPLFIGEKVQNRITYSGLQQLMSRLRKASGVKNLTAHALRRTFAITCLRNHMNIYVLARLMGHTDLTILKQYLDMVKDDLQTAHEESGPVDNLEERESGRKKK